MGRQDYSQIGRGFTVEEARRNGRDDARDMYGDQEGYSGAMNCSTDDYTPKCLKKPKIAKTCKVEKTVQKGTRKWETVFVIEQRWGFSGDNYPKGKTMRCTQGQAIKEAKKMALANQQEYTIRIDKQLVQGIEEIATVSPKKSEAGEWLFTGMARC